jgi:hypothetical protein
MHKSKIITHIDFLKKIINVAHFDFLLEIQRGLKINVPYTNFHYETQRGLNIGFYSPWQRSKMGTTRMWLSYGFAP